LVTKFCDLKGALFCVDFGEAEHIRLTPLCDNEPKDTEKSPFKAGSDFNALAMENRGKPTWSASVFLVD